MKIKVNDNVKVLAGEDKGKTGKVLKTLKAQNKVVVEGVNISKRHTKPRTSNESGGIFEIEMPIDVSNVKLIDKNGKNTKKVSKKTEVKEVKDEGEEKAKKETKAKDDKPTKKTAKKASK